MSVQSSIANISSFIFEYTETDETYEKASRIFLTLFGRVCVSNFGGSIHMYSIHEQFSHISKGRVSPPSELGY